MNNKALSNNDLLSIACYQNDFNEVKRLISIGTVPVMSTYDEPLTIAAIDGHLDIVKFLIKNGADVNARQGIALRRCIEKNNQHEFEILKLLVEAGADVRVLNDIVLRQACITSTAKVVEYLIKKGCDIRSWNKHQDGDLVKLAKRNKVDSLNILKLLNKLL